MRITKLESFLCNAGLRNYLFLKLHTDEGIVGVSEASLEWQEEATQRVLHEFFEKRYVIGANPFDVESLCRRMVRDQYQGSEQRRSRQAGPRRGRPAADIGALPGARGAQGAQVDPDGLPHQCPGPGCRDVAA